MFQSFSSRPGYFDLLDRRIDLPSTSSIVASAAGLVPSRRAVVVWMDESVAGSFEEDVPQVRFYKDWLRVLCDPNIRDAPTVGLKERQGAPEGRALNLSDVPIPEKFQNVLRRGPKFSEEPSVRPEERRCPE
ncbi:hypothetical protein HPB52_021938 [Rhipicephalus sanguineus]|uniref:Uncharacterized protein n=1 Tax=Rhipicephalus sanguineus TaxID=34632 RepID=A0A9D4T367_RHISA|nr:hypothetical protein HPB52_021938 [Rhipicephalus sanguineus]